MLNRNEYRADLVTLIADTRRVSCFPVCGIAWIDAEAETGFSINDAFCTSASYVVAHGKRSMVAIVNGTNCDRYHFDQNFLNCLRLEFGHNMGCQVCHFPKQIYGLASCHSLPLTLINLQPSIARPGYSELRDMSRRCLHRYIEHKFWASCSRKIPHCHGL